MPWVFWLVQTRDLRGPPWSLWSGSRGPQGAAPSWVPFAWKSGPFSSSPSCLAVPVLCLGRLRSTRIFEFWETTSRLFPDSARCLVRQWMHGHPSVSPVFSTWWWTSDSDVDSRGNDFEKMLAYSALLARSGCSFCVSLTELWYRISHKFHVEVDSSPYQGNAA